MNICPGGDKYLCNFRIDFFHADPQRGLARGILGVYNGPLGNKESRHVGVFQFRRIMERRSSPRIRFVNIYLAKKEIFGADVACCKQRPYVLVGRLRLRLWRAFAGKTCCGKYSQNRQKNHFVH